MPEMRVEVAADCANLLGEGPVWSAGEERLYWVDIKRPSLNALTSDGGVRSWPLSSAAGCLALCEDGGLILSCVDGLALFDTEKETRTVFHPMTYGPEGVRPNDGDVDPLGRFWFGTMWDGNTEKEVGCIYRFDGDQSPVEQFSGIHIPNTVAWSIDQKTMYLGDSRKSTIWAYDYDVESGSVGARRVFCVVDEEHIVPDGSALDNEGCLWNAQWGGGRVVRYTPDGQVDRVISIPTDNVTSCAFGGSDLDILYVTTASIELSSQKLSAQPHAGHLFSIHNTGVRGVPGVKVSLQ